jgi:hypothetical protein
VQSPSHPKLSNLSGQARKNREEWYMPKPWTAEDVLTLQAMAHKHPPEQIAAELGRGVTATMVKAYDLRIPLKVKSLGSRLDLGSAGSDLAK